MYLLSLNLSSGQTEFHIRLYCMSEVWSYMYINGLFGRASAPAKIALAVASMVKQIQLES